MKFSSLLKYFVCFGTVALIGCAALSSPPAVRFAEELSYEFTTADRGYGKIHKWYLPSKRSISRSEVHLDPEYPLKKCAVYAQVAEGNWKRLAEVKTPIKTPPYIVNTSVKADAIRVTHSAQMGDVTDIVLYGPETTGGSPSAP